MECIDFVQNHYQTDFRFSRKYMVYQSVNYGGLIVLWRLFFSRQKDEKTPCKKTKNAMRKDKKRRNNAVRKYAIRNFKFVDVSLGVIFSFRLAFFSPFCGETTPRENKKRKRRHVKNAMRKDAKRKDFMRKDKNTKRRQINVASEKP